MTNITSSQTLNKLEEWVRQESHSSNLLDFYRSLLRIQAEVEERITIAKPELNEQTAFNRLVRGKPLLRFEDIITNWPTITDTFNRITAVFTDYGDLFGKVSELLLEEKWQKKLTKQIVRNWLEGKGLPATIASMEINPYLLDSLIHQALRPFLIRHSRVLINLVDREVWRRGSCFICNGQSDIGYLEKKVGARWLMCSRCDTEWHFQRLKCPYCGNQDSNSLSWFGDDDGVYRLYVCDRCHTYLKVVDLRNAKIEAFLPLERILTLDMDRQGQEKGYHPGYVQIENINTTLPK
ncbi:MAG: formate dehydrogenase accessory protein FdhE [Dehalococcoidia bacterium]|nr:MAG: formate dehydrogenase accessory protein FdhE [Dehalococcoidia bacterium]